MISKSKQLTPNGLHDKFTDNAPERLTLQVIDHKVFQDAGAKKGIKSR